MQFTAVTAVNINGGAYKLNHCDFSAHGTFYIKQKYTL